MKVMKISHLLGIALFTALLGSAEMTRAETIFDNLNPGGPSLSIGIGGSPSSMMAAARFNTDDTNLTLNSISLLMYAGGPYPGGTMALGIFSDAGGVPGANLVTLGFFTVPPSLGEGTFVNDGLSISGIFAPNTNYWVVVGSITPTAPPAFAWLATDVAGVGSGFQSVAATSANGGASWSALSAPPGYTPEMRLVMTPEPGSAALLLIGVGLLATRRRSNGRC